MASIWPCAASADGAAELMAKAARSEAWAGTFIHMFIHVCVDTCMVLLGYAICRSSRLHSIGSPDFLFTGGWLLGFMRLCGYTVIDP